jgi:hypothetical protein
VYVYLATFIFIGIVVICMGVFIPLHVFNLMVSKKKKLWVLVVGNITIMEFAMAIYQA